MPFWLNKIAGATANDSSCAIPAEDLRISYA